VQEEKRERRETSENFITENLLTHRKLILFYIDEFGVNQLAPIKEDCFLEDHWSKSHLVLGKLMENWSENLNLLNLL